MRRLIKIRRQALLNPIARRFRLARRRPGGMGSNRMDFSRGIAELADSLTEGRPSRLSSRFSLHNNELVLAIQSAVGGAAPYRLTTDFELVEPMPWAAGPAASSRR